jgi:hypothetical protein
MVEIYNEEIRDLLAPVGKVTGKHTIVHDLKRGTTAVTDVTMADVRDVQEVNTNVDSRRLLYCTILYCT